MLNDLLATSENQLATSGDQSSNSEPYSATLDIQPCFHRFLELPPEIRNDIYKYLMIFPEMCRLQISRPDRRRNSEAISRSGGEITTGLLLVSRQIYHEVSHILYSENNVIHLEGHFCNLCLYMDDRKMFLSPILRSADVRAGWYTFPSVIGGNLLILCDYVQDMISALHKAYSEVEYSDSRTLYIQFHQDQVQLPPTGILPVEQMIFDECNKRERYIMGRLRAIRRSRKVTITGDMTDAAIELWNNAIDAAATINYVECRQALASS